MDLPDLSSIPSRMIFERWMETSVVRGEPPLSESSATVYRSMWGKYCSYLDDQRYLVMTADGALIARFAEAMKPGIRPRYLQLLNRIYTWLLTCGHVRSNPVEYPLKAYRPASLNRPAPAAMPRHIAKQLLEALPKGDGLLAARDRAIITLILGSGVKVSELIRLRPSDVVFDQGPAYLYIVSSGTSNERLAPLAAFAHADVKRWIGLRGKSDGALFPGSGGRGSISAASVYRRVAGVATAAGVDLRHIGPMMLRHTFAVRQVAEERPIPVVQQWLGHHQQRSTEVYQKMVVNPKGWEPA